MAGEDALLDAIAASPDDDGPRHVYADWLEERGRHDDARRFRAQLAYRCDPDNDDALRAAIASLPQRGTVAGVEGMWLVQASWQRGLAEQVTIRQATRVDQPHPRLAEPIKASVPRLTRALTIGSRALPGDLDWTSRLPILDQLNIRNLTLGMEDELSRRAGVKGIQLEARRCLGRDELRRVIYARQSPALPNDRQALWA